MPGTKMKGSAEFLINKSAVRAREPNAGPKCPRRVGRRHRRYVFSQQQRSQPRVQACGQPARVRLHPWILAAQRKTGRRLSCARSVAEKFQGPDLASAPGLLCAVACRRLPNRKPPREIQDALFSRDELAGIPIDLQLQFLSLTDTRARLAVLAHLDIKQLHFGKADGRSANTLTITTGLFDTNGNYITALQKTARNAPPATRRSKTSKPRALT